MMGKIDIRPIKSEKDYDWALKEIEPYFEHEPRKGTPEADRFDILATLIEAYEARRWPIEPPGVTEAIRFRMDLHGLKQADLAKLLGSRSRASEILANKRSLTMEQAWKLHKEWQIPADVLLRSGNADDTVKPSKNYALLRQAITEHFCLSAHYRNQLRHFSPYALGLDAKGKHKVLVFQYGGESASGRLPKNGEWRCFDVHLLSTLKRNRDVWRAESGAHSRPNSCVTEIDVEVGRWRPD